MSVFGIGRHKVGISGTIGILGNFYNVLLGFFDRFKLKLSLEVNWGLKIGDESGMKISFRQVVLGNPGSFLLTRFGNLKTNV